MKEKLEPGGTYSWGVKLKYDFGESQWEWTKFTIRPDQVKNLRKEETSVRGEEESEIKSVEISFKWDNPGNAKYYEIELNGHTCEAEWYYTSYTIEEVIKKDEVNKHLCTCGWNTLVVWAISYHEKSKPVRGEPAKLSFKLLMEKLNPPDINTLSPNSGEPVNTERFYFSWGRVSGATEYEIQLFDSQGKLVKLPKKNEKGDSVRVYSDSYDPWSERNWGEFAGLKLKPGEIYMWKVRAWPHSIDSRKESEWTTVMFGYQPVLLEMLALFSAIGGFLGGFIRVANTERIRAKEKKQKIKLYLDYWTFVDLLVGLIIGVVFYLIVNQTLSQELNPFNIPAYSYVGSFLLGFIGGLISYDITRLRKIPRLE